MEPAQAEPYDAVRHLLVQLGGGFLRNVRWIPDRTCDRCAGIPGPGYSRCLACSTFGLLLERPDRLGFVTYAYWGSQGHQSGQVMHRYKDPSPPPAATRVMTLLLAYALRRHLICAAGVGYGPPDAWAVVPSLKHDGPHRLAQIAAPFLPDLAPIPLGRAPGAVSTRTFQPDSFVSAPAAGRHVLLLDDTYATGAHVHSAAAALRRSGATHVTALIVARWLDPTWSHTSSFIASDLTADFDPDICPFTGELCWPGWSAQQAAQQSPPAF